MTPEPRISRRALVSALLFVSIAVVTGTVLDRSASSRDEEAVARLLRLQVLRGLDQAMAPVAWTASETSRLERLLGPHASLADFRAGLQQFLVDARVEDGIQRFQTHLKRTPQDARTQWALGKLLLATGRIREAKVLAQQARTLQPDLWPAQSLLAATLASEGRLAEALELCKKLLLGADEADPARMGAAYSDGALYTFRLGRSAEALEMANRSLQWFQQTENSAISSLDRAQALFVRASIYLHLQSPLEADADLEAALGLSSKFQARALQIQLLSAQSFARRSRGLSAQARILELRVAQLLHDNTDEERLQSLLTLPDSVPRSDPA